MPNFGYIDGQLCAGRVPLADIAARFGTPCYVYSQAAIESAWSAYENAFGSQPHLVCYAVKANGNLAVIHVLARLGAGFDIVSVGELERVLAAGGDAGRTVFSGVGKRADEMRRALEAGIRCFNVESFSELRRLNDMASAANTRAPVALRINPDVDPGTHPYIATGSRQTKFGISYEDALRSCAEAAALPGIRLTGIACHIGSQITTLEPYLRAADRMVSLLHRLREAGIVLRQLDMGGGMGVQYSGETPPTPEQVVGVLRDRIADSDCELLIEPGRSIVANAGVLLTRVECIKENDGRHFAVVDAGMNDFLRPALYQAWHDILPVAINPGRPGRCYDVVGPVCETGDLIGASRTLSIAEGDLLAVCSAGAYAACMSSNYNTRPRGAEVLIDGKEIHLVRQREAVADLFSLERFPPD
jgi:diaminopimelate decarboxylase